MSDAILRAQREAWDRKPGLRALYGRWHAAMRGFLAPGPSLEVGAGIGQLKEALPGLFTLDILPTPWTDMVGDAQELPVRSGSLGNIVLFDVLHHLPRPARFFDEACRALRPGGRILVMDPYVSPLSWPVYRFLHPEGLRPGCDPLDEACALSTDEPFDSNQGVATALFWRRAGEFARRFPRLKVLRRERLALWSYPLTGGFSGRTLVPESWIVPLADLERPLSFLAPLLAFRTLVVLEHDA
ncbi:MAG: class I SAM-dependent methyltransferase [Thermodesulfobacteriota bacterium]